MMYYVAGLMFAIGLAAIHIRKRDPEAAALVDRSRGGGGEVSGFQTDVFIHARIPD